MTRILARLQWPALGLLAAVVVAVPTPVRSQSPDNSKQIADVEKQIAELQKKLAEMKTPAATAAGAAAIDGTLPDTALKQLTWRNIGPANMGGRVTALAVYDADPAQYYVATASGGLLKTINNGTTFTFCFDKEATVSIGDVAVCQTNPDLVWVGSGEANPRNSVSYGDGAYKSTDGGKSWTNMGLKKSFSIGKVLIHPKNPDIVYVGALGRLYGPGGDRGVFKTEDGGKTWKNVLFTDANTGVIDMRFDPTDPETIIAALWERKRDEFDGFFGEAPVPDSYGPIVTHGPGGGLWKTSDGGKAWKKLNDAKLNNGLPTVKTGRIGLDYSRKTKGLVYAIIDTEKVGTGEAVRQVYMGVVGETVDGVGAKLLELTAGGPGEKAGLKADDVVIKADDKAIAGYDALIDVIRTKKAGDKAKLTVKRGDKELVIEVTLENRPGAETPTRGGAAGAAGGGRGGAGAAAGGGRGGAGGGRGAGGAAAASSRPVVGVTFGTGTTITAVTKDGPAEKAGLKVGDVVVSVEGKPVTSQEEFRAAIGDDRKAGDKVKLKYTRDNKDAEVEVTLAAPAATAAVGGGPGAPGAGLLMPGFAPAVEPQATEVKVGTVAAGGPAEKAGIKVGDVILEVDGKKIEGFRDVITALRVSPREDNPRVAGDKVKVKIKQGDKILEVELALAPMQVAGFGGGQGGGPARGTTNTRPYGLGLGGQQPNIQDNQGKDSFQTGGIFASSDNGETWKRINSLNPRPMYFSVIRIDPADDKILYVLCDTPTPIYRSADGGKSFTNLRTAGGVHADAHALWVNPKNGKNLIIGCDGGFYATYDTGATWDHLNTLALGQFYHVAVDSKKPYRVYGGLQDNGSWAGPSNTLRSYGPVNEDWLYVNGGDGFVCRVDPTDPDLIYTESQGGAMARRNLRTGERGFIRPAPKQGEPAYRFNWNTPYILSSHNPSIFYAAGDYVFKSIKKGTDLRKVSPDITRTKAGSATAVAESPLNPDILWAGTDDGFVWVTKDGGTTWTNVTDAIKAAGLPGFRCVGTIETSRDKDGRCYVCFDAHRSDDDKPYVFVTNDLGKTWKPIMGNLPAFGSTRCLREDYTNPEVLYCGTEFGAFVTANRGATWAKLGGNLPTVAVHEFAQPTTASELVVATHGRSVWVIDVASLRQMSAEALKAKATLFAPPVVTRWRTGLSGESPYSNTDRKFVGTNPPAGTSLDYMLGKPAEKLSLKVVDAAGKTVREFAAAPKVAGFHRVAWNLSRAGGAGGAGAAGGGGGGGGRGNFGGGAVAPGAYRVVLSVDGTEFAHTLVVEIDPNAPKDLISLEEEESQIEPANPLKPKKTPAWLDN